MNFTRADMGIIFASVMAIVFMSFIMPAMGQSGVENATESDLPEFNMSSSEFDIVGDFPKSPGQPDAGTIQRYENRTLLDQHIDWLDRPKDNGFSVELTNFSGDMMININNWSAGSSVAKDLYNITSEGQQVRHNNESWSILFTVEHYANHNQSDMSAIVDYDVIQSPQDDEGGLLQNLPVIGWLWGAGEYLALTLAYIGDIIFWLVGTSFEVTVAVVGVLLSVVTFGVDTIVYLVTTYNDVVNQASDWAVVITTIPAILLSLEFAKLGMIGVSLLPFT